MNRAIPISIAALAVVGSSACSTRPALKITEVAGGTVELYLDESRSQNLDRLSLQVETGAGYSESASLVGTMPGESFLVVFEEIGYSGGPVAATYSDPFTGDRCSGIKMAENTFGWNQGGTSFAFRLSGRSSRVGGLAGLFQRRWQIDDVVTFGTRPRPSIGGSFTEDTTVPVGLPVPPGSVSRSWAAGAPIDNDLESDWGNKFPSFCRETQ